MTHSIQHQILFVIVLVLTISSTSALSVDELIDSYDFDFNDGPLDVTAKVDFMEDRDSDGTNDTLVINVTTNVSSGTYHAFVDLEDDNGLIVENVTQTMSAGNMNFVFNFSTVLFSQGVFNYTIRIEDENRTLVYEEHNTETDDYTTYNRGTTITLITDENVNNDYIQVNLTLNVTVNETVNVTVAMLFNDSKISVVEEKTLTNGSKTVTIKFDNETIKGTHYDGQFTIDSVTFGRKVYELNQTTSSYNYEDFAKTSYVRNFSDGVTDLDNDNLSDFLEINVTLNITSSGTYTLEADLYDQFDTFLASINETQSLSPGHQVVTAQINGSLIYKSSLDGPFVVSFVRLANDSDTKDVRFNAYTTNVTFFEDFELHGVLFCSPIGVAKMWGELFYVCWFVSGFLHGF